MTDTLASLIGKLLQISSKVANQRDTTVKTREKLVTLLLGDHYFGSDSFFGLFDVLKSFDNKGKIDYIYTRESEEIKIDLGKRQFYSGNRIHEYVVALRREDQQTRVYRGDRQNIQYELIEANIDEICNNNELFERFSQCVKIICQRAIPFYEEKLSYYIEQNKVTKKDLAKLEALAHVGE